MSDGINQVVWFEVFGREPQQLQGFYGEMFGWKYDHSQGLSYGMVSKEQTGLGGGVGAPPKPSRDMPLDQGWTTFYVRVEDISKASEKAQKLGAKVVIPITQIPNMSYTVLADPQGNPVGLIQNNAE